MKLKKFTYIIRGTRYGFACEAEDFTTAILCYLSSPENVGSWTTEAAAIECDDYRWNLFRYGEATSLE